jgi:hypothetical protein
MARKKNPSPLATVALLAAVVGGGYLVYREMKPKPKKAVSGVSPLSGVYTPGSTLGNSPGVMGAMVMPVMLSFAPDVRNPQTGEIGSAGTNVVTLPMLSALVTNLTPTATRDAYGYMEYLIASKGYNLGNAVVRDQAVQETLNKIGARRVDWSKGLAPYVFGSPESQTWLGVQLLGELAQGTFNNKAAMG